MARAQALGHSGGVCCARLPIAECLPDAQYRVLNCDTVFTALQTQLQIQEKRQGSSAGSGADGLGGQDADSAAEAALALGWQEALQRTIPARKQQGQGSKGTKGQRAHGEKVAAAAAVPVASPGAGASSDV